MPAGPRIAADRLHLLRKHVYTWEVEEETGWRPGRLKPITTFQPMVGMVDSPHEVFIGRGAERIGEPTDAEEDGHAEWVPLSDVRDLMAQGELMRAPVPLTRTRGPPERSVTVSSPGRPRSSP